MKGDPGTLIHATMRTQDLIPAFVDELERLDDEGTYTEVITEGRKIIQDASWDTEKTSMFLNEDLFDALNDLAPEDHYFGAHPGDGSDYGFWPVEN